MSRQGTENVITASKLIVKITLTLIDVIGIGIFLGSGEKSTSYWPILALLLVAFIILALKLISEISLLNLLMLVAQRGHLHTLRMILLICNDKPHEKKYLYNGSASFAFELVGKTNKKSTVKYSHTFEGKRSTQRKFAFSTWLFGDEGIAPTDVDIRVDTQSQDSENVYSVGVSCLEDPYHDGIYKFDWEIPHGERNCKTKLELNYQRKDAFVWNKDDIFVIYPKGFMKGIKTASFSVFVDPKDDGAISSVDYTELVCGLQSRAKDSVKMRKQKDKDGKCFYSTKGELEINEENLYIITVHLNSN